MRIALAHTRLTGFGGGERATLELARRLSARHSVTLWTADYRPAQTFAALAQFPLRLTPAAAWLTQPLDADVIIAQNFGARLLALRSRRVLAYIHTMRSRYLQGAGRPDLAARRTLDRLSTRRAARLLTNSAFTAARATAVYGRTPEVAPLGADEAYFDLEATAGDYALYVGRLAPEKGVARLMAWHAGVAAPLELVGAGSAAERARLPETPGAHLSGPLTGDELARMYAGARYFAFAPYAEEFGLAALDAMAAAKPVIAVRDGALPELVEDGATGYLVHDAASYRQAAEQLLASDALCLRMGLAARERARAFTWERHARRIEQVCEEIARQSAQDDAPGDASSG